MIAEGWEWLVDAERRRRLRMAFDDWTCLDRGSIYGYVLTGVFVELDEEFCQESSRPNNYQGGQRWIGPQEFRNFIE